ncbi:MAG TPA: hypothetical protein VM124_00025 [Candidatus Limnocylindrales bacterium]|nr:hypothetical protein [Candidatus Limnocylindrales bacterium]
MIGLKNDQAGVSHIVAVFFILAIGVIGAVALHISSAQRLRYTPPTINRPTSYGSSSVCSSNGVTMMAPAGQSCSITKDASGVHCKVNGADVACPAAGSPSTAKPGTPGAATNYTNINTSTGSNGSAGSSVCSADGHRITGPNCSISSDSSGVHCKVNGAEVPCEY